MPRKIHPAEVLRRRLRYTSQGELAEELGVAQSAISAVLHRKQEPGPKLLEALGLKKVVIYERI